MTDLKLENELPKLPKTKRKTISEQLSLIKKNISVEPILLCYIMPNIVASIATQNLNLSKACRVNLAYSREICDRLALQDKEGIEEIEQEVQALVSGMNTWMPFIRFPIPLILLLFFGPMSDRLGTRKPFILIPIFGEILTAIGLIACTYFESWPMEVAGISQHIFSAITGGHIIIMMAVYSHISDISTTETRTFRIGILSTVLSIVFPVGAASSGVLYKILGFYGVFTITGLIHVIGFTYGIFYIPSSNTKQTDETGTNQKIAFKQLFSVKDVVENFNVVFKKREGNLRSRIVMLVLVYYHISGIRSGEAEIWYMYYRLKFNWDEIDYSIYDTFWCVINFIGNSFTVGLLVKKCKLDDAMLGIIGCVTMVISFLIYGFVQTTTGMYFATIFEVVCGCPDIGMRALSSKLVAANELGTMNSVFGIGEAFVGMIYKPIYNKVYKKTLSVFPGAFCIVTSVCFIPSALLFIGLYIMKGKDVLILVPTQEENVEDLEEEGLSEK